MPDPSWYEPGFSTQRENLEAANRTIVETVPVNTEASKLKDAWTLWYDNLNGYQMSYDGNTWDVARNKRRAFFIANTSTESERKEVTELISSGMSSEQQAGEPDRRLASGEYPTDKSSGTSLYIAGAVAFVGYLLFRRK